MGTPKDTRGHSRPSTHEADASRLPPHHALRLLAKRPWLITSSHGDKRAGMVVEHVFVAGFEPALIGVAAAKGHPVEPLIRDSHHFGLCLLDPSDRVMLRRFAVSRMLDEPGDPFDALEVDRLVTGMPLLRGSHTVLDCDVHRHVDIDSDLQIYVGLVVGGRVEGHLIQPQELPDHSGE